MTKPEPEITEAVARQVGDKIGVDWKEVNWEQFMFGMRVELEHGARNDLTNVTNDDLEVTGKIALAHLLEFPDYYMRLAYMEEEAREYWEKHGRKIK